MISCDLMVHPHCLPTSSPHDCFRTRRCEVEPPSASSTEKPGRRPVSSRPIRTPWDWDWIAWWCFILSYTLLGDTWGKHGKRTWKTMVSRSETIISSLYYIYIYSIYIIYIYIYTLYIYNIYIYRYIYIDRYIYIQ